MKQMIRVYQEIFRKKFLLVLGTLFLLIPSIVMMQKSMACNDTPVVKNHIQTNGGMVPITLGTNLNSMGAITSLIQVYANPTNKRFAIVEHFAAQKSCILVQGYNFDILMQFKETF